MSHAFGTVAEAYHRWRTAIPYEAFDWLAPQPCRRAVELGAGTGIQTRRLRLYADELVAVEPDPKMRAAFAVDGVKLLAGAAEDIPVEDGWADLAVAFESWHWFIQPQTTHEVARVLKPGGTLAVAWNLPDTVEPWARDFWWPVTQAHDESRRPGRLILAQSVFDKPQYRILRWTWRASADDIVALLGTYSRVLALDPLARKEFLERQRAVLPGETVDVPFTTVCWRTIHKGA